jgi:hypothetical protein
MRKTTETSIKESVLRSDPRIFGITARHNTVQLNSLARF